VNVLFVHRGRDVPSARVRILALLPHLEALGIGCRAVEHPSNARALRALVNARDRPDAFVLQKKLPTPADAWAWRGRRAPLLFDFDDAVMFRQQPRGASFESRTRSRRFGRALRLCDAFVCGNAYLASFARGAGKPVLVAPSAVPLEVPTSRARIAGRPVRVGWLGSPENLPSLAALAPVLRRVAAERDFRLAVVSRQGIDLPGISVEHVPWTLAGQERDLASLDVGLMPLDDSPWSRGKCAYKLLQYMAAGVPVVASPVGMNTEVVADGVNGLLAATPDAWFRALIGLIDDADLAWRLGRAGRETVVARFGYPGVARDWRDFLDALVASETSPLAAPRSAETCGLE
jgi:glycosyltransferase involved in cell wall biosynthesis